MYHEKPNPEDSLSLSKIRNIDIAHQLILKPRQPDDSISDEPKMLL